MRRDVVPTSGGSVQTPQYVTLTGSVSAMVCECVGVVVVVKRSSVVVGLRSVVGEKGSCTCSRSVVGAG